MITDFFLTLPAKLALTVLSILPDISPISLQFVNGLKQIWDYVIMFSFIVPIEAIVFMLAIVIPFDIAMFGWGAFNWVLKKIPGIN